jgi:hypothetical protein
MVRSLNRSFGVVLIALCSVFGAAQETNYSQIEEKKNTDKDYQDKEAFKKFRTRAQQVSAWQIQNLKFGALVVRLQNNQRKVDAYRQVGNEAMALETMARTQYLNKVMMKCFQKGYDLSKVYFIYAQCSDSLLNGKKQGIFLDTSLKVNPNIVMSENFYVLAESDYVYNTSIGFIKEDSAKFVTEAGAQTVYAPIVLKNKYGHQLKDPFPYYVDNINTIKKEVINVTWPVELSDGTHKNVKLELNKEYSPKLWDLFVQRLNVKVHDFYQKSAGFQLKDATLKPFLY